MGTDLYTARCTERRELDRQEALAVALAAGSAVDVAEPLLARGDRWAMLALELEDRHGGGPFVPSPGALLRLLDEGGSGSAAGRGSKLFDLFPRLWDAKFQLVDRANVVLPLSVTQDGRFATVRLLAPADLVEVRSGQTWPSRTYEAAREPYRLQGLGWIWHRATIRAPVHPGRRSLWFGRKGRHLVVRGRWRQRGWRGPLPVGVGFAGDEVVALCPGRVVALGSDGSHRDLCEVDPRISIGVNKVASRGDTVWVTAEDAIVVVRQGGVQRIEARRFGPRCVDVGDGRVLVGGEKGLAELREGALNGIVTAPKVTSVTTVRITPDGTAWCHAAAGVLQWVSPDGRSERVSGKRAGIGDLFDILARTDSEVWVAATEGVFSVAIGREPRPAPIQEVLGSRRVRALAERDGTVYALLFDGNLLVARPGDAPRVIVWTEPVKLGAAFGCWLTADPRGGVWFQIDGNTFHVSRDDIDGALASAPLAPALPK